VEREERAARMRERWKDPEYAAYISAKLQEAAAKRRASKEAQLTALAQSDPEEFARRREEALAKRRALRARQQQDKAERLAQLAQEDPEEYERLCEAEDAALRARRDRHNAARRERRAAAREAAGLEPAVPRARRPAGPRSSGGGGQRGPRRPKAAGSGGEQGGGADDGMPLISSGRSLRGAKAAAGGAKRPRARKAADGAAGDGPSTSGSGSGGSGGGGRKLAKASAEAIAEVQGRLSRLMETRQLVTRTQGMVTQLTTQMGAFANNPQMAERAAAALDQATARLAAAQQQVAELEASVPDGVVWDERTGVIMEVQDAAGLAQRLKGRSGGGGGSGSSGGGGNSRGGGGGGSSGGAPPSAAGPGFSSSRGGGGLNGLAHGGERSGGAGAASPGNPRSGAAAVRAADAHAMPAPSLGMHLQTLLDAVDGSSAAAC
jgi:hypothetical protein